jgi:hypothetical protein
VRRRAIRSDVRDRYTETVRKWNEKYAWGTDRFGAKLAQLEAGGPVIVNHGWEIGLNGYSGPFVIESDGEVVPVEIVYAASPPARPRTANDYRRPDGSLVYGDSRFGNADRS